MMQAAKRGQTEALALLLDAGASINSVDRRGWSAAHWACRNGSASTLALLRSRGADLLAQTAHRDHDQDAGDES